jgi:hypothetical protein
MRETPNSYLNACLVMVAIHALIGLVFFYVVKKISNLVFRILGFRRNVTNIHIYQKYVFLCVAYGQYPNIF